MMDNAFRISTAASWWLITNRSALLSSPTGRTCGPISNFNQALRRILDIHTRLSMPL